MGTMSLAMPSSSLRSLLTQNCQPPGASTPGPSHFQLERWQSLHQVEKCIPRRARPFSRCDYDEMQFAPSISLVTFDFPLMHHQVMPAFEQKIMAAQWADRVGGCTHVLTNE